MELKLKLKLDPFPEGNLCVKLFKSAANVTEMAKQYLHIGFGRQNYLNGGPFLG